MEPAIREYLSQIGKKGAAALSEEQRATLASNGGKARAAKLTKTMRKEIARRAARARWNGREK